MFFFQTRHRRWVLLWSRHFPWLSATGTRGFVGCVPIFLVEGPKTEESVSFLNCPTRGGWASVVGKFFFVQVQKNDKIVSSFFGLTFPKWLFDNYIVFVYSYIFQLRVGFLGPWKPATSQKEVQVAAVKKAVLALLCSGGPGSTPGEGFPW